MVVVDDPGYGIGLCQPTYLAPRHEDRAAGGDGRADGSGDHLRDFMQKRVPCGGPVDERGPWDTVGLLASRGGTLMAAADIATNDFGADSPYPPCLVSAAHTGRARN